MKLNLQICPENEQHLFYSSNEIKSCIGHLRGDFGSGNEFYTSWFDKNMKLKTDDFKTELNKVINTLRTDYEYAVLTNRKAMESFLYFNPNYKIPNRQYNTIFAIKIDTKDNTYYLRCNPVKGDYEFYCYCYNADMLKKELLENQPQKNSHKREVAR